MSATSNAISGDFLQQALVTNFVKGLAEVHHQNVSLITPMTVAHKVMVKLDELRLAREHTPKAML